MFEPTYWQWMIAGFFLIGLELFISTFVTLWFGLAAVIVGAALSLVPMALGVQLSLWLGLSVLGVVFWFAWAAPRRKKRSLSDMRQAVISQTATVIKVPSVGQKGLLRFYSPILGVDEWLFESDETIEFGDTVIVLDLIDRKTLNVKPVS